MDILEIRRKAKARKEQEGQQSADSLSPAAEPERTPEAALEPTPEPVAEPVPEPVPQPVAPETAAEPAPQPVAEPAPAPFAPPPSPPETEAQSLEYLGETEDLGPAQLPDSEQGMDAEVGTEEDNSGDIRLLKSQREDEEDLDTSLLAEFFASTQDAAINQFAEPTIYTAAKAYSRADPDLKRFLVCRAFGEDYGVDLRYTREIQKPLPLTSVPRAPDYVLGVVSIRGVVLPLVDLARRLSGPVAPEPGRSERYIYIDYLGEGLCLRVESVSNVVGFGGGDIEPPPPGLRGIETDFILGIGRVDERMIILLNMDEVIGGLLKQVR